MHEDTARAVSDVIAFTLAFSIIIGAVGFVYVSGFDALETTRDVEDRRAASRSIQGIAETFEDVHRRSVPSRSIEISLDGGSLDLVDSEIGVEIRRPGDNVQESLDVRALRLRPNEDGATHMAYEGGAAFWVQEQGSLVLHRPVMRCTGNIAIISLVRLRGDASAADSGAVQITGERIEQRSRTIYPNTEAGQTAQEAFEVEVDVSNSANQAQWERYFGPRGDWQGTDEQFTCNVGANGRVYLRVTTIRINTLY